jgi:hypothetical protein
MKLRLLIATVALFGLAACGSPSNVSDLEQRVADLEAWATDAHTWSQEVNVYLTRRALQWQDLQNAVSELCTAASIPEAECPDTLGDETNPPSGRPPKYPPD